MSFAAGQNEASVCDTTTMKVFISIVCAMASIAMVRPEPPVNQYLSPADNYITTNDDSMVPSLAALSSTYGAPSSGYSVPSSTYGAPSSAYSVPSSTYGAPSSGYSVPSSKYGAPSSRYSVPSSTYGAPSSAYSVPSSTYDALSGYAAPSSAYGTPSTASMSSFSFFRGSSKSLPKTKGLSHMHGTPHTGKTGAIFGTAPDSMYGVPAINHMVPSLMYGVPGYARYHPTEDDMPEPANYQFSYEVQDAHSGSEFGHLESKQGDAAWGSYNVVLPDGRKQIVEYEADQRGFRPMIRYEEPLAGYGRGASGPY